MTVIASGLSKDAARTLEQLCISAYSLAYLDNARREVGVKNVVNHKKYMDAMAEIIQSVDEERLYDWVGDEVPPLDIIEGLHYIVLGERGLGRRTEETIQFNRQILSEMHPEMKATEYQKVLLGLEDVKIVTRASIDMLELRELKKRITYVGHDDSPERQNDPFLKTKITDVVISVPESFDRIRRSS